MLAALMGGLAALLGSALARVLIGAAMSVVVYSGVNAGVDTLVGEFENAVTGLPSHVLSILAMSGAGVALNIVVSTVITVAAVSVAGRVAGVKKG